MKEDFNSHRSCDCSKKNSDRKPQHAVTSLSLFFTSKPPEPRRECVPTGASLFNVIRTRSGDVGDWSVDTKESTTQEDIRAAQRAPPLHTSTFIFVEFALYICARGSQRYFDLQNPPLWVLLHNRKSENSQEAPVSVCK